MKFYIETKNNKIHEVDSWKGKPFKGNKVLLTEYTGANDYFPNDSGRFLYLVHRNWPEASFHGINSFHAKDVISIWSEDD